MKNDKTIEAYFVEYTVRKIPYYLISSYWLLISVYSWLCGPGQWLINIGRYTIGRGVDIPWVRSSIFHGGIEINWPGFGHNFFCTSNSQSMLRYPRRNFCPWYIKLPTIGIFFNLMKYVSFEILWKFCNFLKFLKYWKKNWNIFNFYFNLYFYLQFSVLIV